VVIICCCQYKERNSPLKEADVVNAEMKMPRRGRDDGGREGAGASHFLRFLLGDRRKVYFLRSAKIGHLSFHHDNLKFPPCHALTQLQLRCCSCSTNRRWQKEGVIHSQGV